MPTSDLDARLRRQPPVGRRGRGEANIEEGMERSLRFYAHGFGLYDLEIGRLIDADMNGTSDMRSPSRASISTGAIMLPMSVEAQGCRFLGDATIAHAIGHLRYSVSGRPVGTTVPMMVAIQSLIEDSRIERLMMQEYPGLWALWNRFHRTSGEPYDKGLTFAALAERLALALHDPSYRDPHHWVEKGRSLIEGIGADLGNVSRFQEVASILASDLGQMRVRFDPQSYVVEPAYRDDNTFLWHFDEDEPIAAVARPNGGQPQSIDNAHQDLGSDDSERGVEAEAHDLKFLYPEWNYKAEVLRQDWVGVVEGRALRVAQMDVAKMPPRYKRGAVRVRYRQTLSALRLKRQQDGDDFDLDALVMHRIAQRSGDDLNGNVFTRLGRRPREASVLLLLDLSASTARTLDGTEQTLLDCEREAAEQVIAGFDDDYIRIALHGFASNGRSELRYLRVKDFDAPYSDEHRQRLQELRPAWSTRFGAALRHAGAHISVEKNDSKTIILITDGEPSDIDVFDSRYLLEDARKAVDTLSTHRIRVQCISVEPSAHSAICEIFGRQNCISIERTGRLSHVLQQVLAKAVA